MASSSERRLATYRRKRDFSKTPEPSGSRPYPTTRENALRFVIQKHAASHLHFDFRLELDGVMKSWAIPKGPSIDPSVKRLAMEVEDHPISYNTFEGTIPKGEYGGGTVMLWDSGTYAPENSKSKSEDETVLQRGFKNGKLDFVLNGKRLRGGWTLVRTRRSTSKQQWLLIKRRDASADPDVDIIAQAVTSVATGRTMEEIAGKPPAPNSPRSQGTRPKRATSASVAKQRGSQHRARHTSPSSTPARSSSIIKQLEHLEQDGGAGTLRIAPDRSLNVSSLDKVFFPSDGYTKGDMMRYYAHVARAILSVMADRPLVLKRSPDGLRGETFFQQKPPENTPDVVRVESIENERGQLQERLVGGDIATLLYTVQIGCIAVDPWLSRVGSLDAADFAVLDLDPGPRAPFERVVEVALLVQEALATFGLHGAIKTSGSRGVHIVIPLPSRTPYETALALAQRVATRVAQAQPRRATVEPTIQERPPAAVYVDYLQNAKGKSVAAAYCIRAKPGATISTPLDWTELNSSIDPHAFTIETVPPRLATLGDIWRSAMRQRNSLKAIREVANL